MTAPRQETVFLDRLRIDERLQCREQLDEAVIARYAEAMTRGREFPPLTVFDDGDDLWVADGNHRYHAYGKIGIDQIPCLIHAGTLRDAILYSVGANENHGLIRSPGDKRKAVLTLLRDSEWGSWSDREIGRRTETSHTLVAAVRKEFKSANQPATRAYTTKHGTRSTMDTSRIGRTAAEPKEITSFDDPADIDDEDPPAAGLPDDSPIRQLQDSIQELRKGIAALGHQPVGAFIHFQSVDADLKNAWNALKHARPATSCPYCRGQQPNVLTCKPCRKMGWVPQRIHDAAPKQPKQVA